MKRLSLSGVRCYIGTSFAGALVYADDIVLIASTSNTRKLLAICDDFAAQQDKVFNAEKSKFLVVISHNRRFISNDMRTCNLYIIGKLIENVNHYSHLEHIKNSDFTDDDDIIHRRNSSVGQVNDSLCLFSKQDSLVNKTLVKLKLFQSYCSSFYGCELKPLNNRTIDDLCIAWRKSLRRVLNLPQNSHSYLPPIISGSLRFFR